MVLGGLQVSRTDRPKRFAFLLAAFTVLLFFGCKDEFDLSRDNGKFNLDALLNPAAEEGTIEAPINITGQLPYSGQTGNKKSYYVVNDVSTDTAKQFELYDFNDDLDLRVYDNSKFSNQKCASTNSNTLSESCYFDVDHATLYIMVDGYHSFSGSTFILDMKDLPQAEGQENNPFDITGSVPYSGQVDTNTSYYEVTGLTPNEEYKIAITGAKDEIDLYVYQDTGFFIFTATTLACFNLSGILSESFDVECSAIANDTSFIIQANGSRSEIGSFFTINVQSPTDNEGTSKSPLDITGQTPYDGQVGSVGSYYEIRGLTAGQSYTISLADLDNDVDLEVFDNSNFSTTLCYSNNWFDSDESCSATPAGSSVFVLVEPAYFVTGSGFTLDIN